MNRFRVTRAGEMLLDIEARIGELIDKSKPKDRLPRSADGKMKPFLPEGVNHRRSHQSQQIAKHPEIVERVKAKARENPENRR